MGNGDKAHSCVSDLWFYLRGQRRQVSPDEISVESFPSDCKGKSQMLGNSIMVQRPRGPAARVGKKEEVSQPEVFKNCPWWTLCIAPRTGLPSCPPTCLPSCPPSCPPCTLIGKGLETAPQRSVKCMSLPGVGRRWAQGGQQGLAMRSSGLGNQVPLPGAEVKLGNPRLSPALGALYLRGTGTRKSHTYESQYSDIVASAAAECGLRHPCIALCTLDAGVLGTTLSPMTP